MQRHYFITDNLDDLSAVEHDLEARGVTTEQIHVLSRADTDVEQHHLHDVLSIMKKDVVRSGEWGAMIGALAAALTLAIAYVSGLVHTVVGWLPFVFLAIVLLGFFTWEGGLLGIQTPNARFRRFEEALADGKHVLFVDVDPSQEAVLEDVRSKHPLLTSAGLGASSPRWILSLQRGFKRFVQWAP